MNDEQAIATTVRTAGLTPTEQSRAAIRAALDDASTTSRVRSIGPRRRWMIGVAAGLVAAALTVAGIVVLTGDGPGRRLTPSDTMPTTSVIAPTTPTTPAPATTPVTIDELRDHRWVLIDNSGAAWPTAEVPYIDFLPSDNDQVFLGGFDGCNWFSYDAVTGSLHDSTLRLGMAISTARGCPEGVEGVLPINGDSVRLSADGARLTVVSGDTPRLVFLRLDTLPIPSSTELIDRWLAIGRDSTPLAFASDGTGIFGDCSLTWTMDDQLSVNRWPVDGGCATDIDATPTILDARLANGTSLYLASQRSVLLVTRSSAATPTNSSSPVEVPSGLDDWPPPSNTPPSLSLVPRLLPTTNIPGAVSAFRSTPIVEHEDQAPFVQDFSDVARNARLSITTILGPPNVSTDEFDAIDTAAWPTTWEQAFTLRHSPAEYSAVLLLSPNGSVFLSAMNLSKDEVIELARTMTRQPDGQPGWQLPPTSTLKAFSSGGGAPTAARTMVWVDGAGAPVAELIVGYGWIGLLNSAWLPTSTVATIDLPATTAALVITDPSGRVAIAWSTGAVSAMFTTVADRETAESIVRGLSEVGEDQWNAAASPADPDTCLSLYC